MTCEACVGLGREKRFALGAATGTVAASMIARATGCTGTRTATLERPAVTSSGTWAERGSTSVSGPGQKRRPGPHAVAGTCETSDTNNSSEPTWTIKGSVKGRCFAANRRRTAERSSAFTPRLYTSRSGRRPARLDADSRQREQSPSGPGCPARPE